MRNLETLFCELDKISKEGSSVVVKLDGERWGNLPSLPITVLIFGGRLSEQELFRIDSDDLIGAIQKGIDYYKTKTENLK